jgi:hypothetical protein
VSNEENVKTSTIYRTRKNNEENLNNGKENVTKVNGKKEIMRKPICETTSTRTGKKKKNNNDKENVKNLICKLNSKEARRKIFQKKNQ